MSGTEFPAVYSGGAGTWVSVESSAVERCGVDHPAIWADDGGRLSLTGTHLVGRGDQVGISVTKDATAEVQGGAPSHCSGGLVKSEGGQVTLRDVDLRARDLDVAVDVAGRGSIVAEACRLNGEPFPDGPLGAGDSLKKLQGPSSASPA